MMQYISTLRYIIETATNMVDIPSHVAHAARQGYLQKLKLISKIHGLDTYYSYIISMAAETGNIEVLKYFMQQNYAIPGFVATKAACYDQIAIIDFMAKAKLEPNLECCLVLAAANGCECTVRYLVETRGVNMATSDYLALQLAAEHHHLPVVRYLLSKGACIQKINLVNIWRFSPCRVFLERQIVLRNCMQNHQGLRHIAAEVYANNYHAMPGAETVPEEVVESIYKIRSLPLPWRHF